MTDTLPEVVTAHSVAKRLGIPLVMALEIPTDALMAMSRYIEKAARDEDALMNISTERDMADAYYPTLETHLRKQHRCKHDFSEIANGDGIVAPPSSEKAGPR